MTSDEKDFMELYKIYRSYEEHENQLINQRTTWLVAIQSILLATFGFSYQKYYELQVSIAKDPKHDQITKIMGGLTGRYELFLFIVCLIGFVSAVSARRSIYAAEEAQELIRDRWDNVANSNSLSTTMLPKLAGGGSNSARQHGAAFSRWLTWLFIGLWILILSAVLLEYAFVR